MNTESLCRQLLAGGALDHALWLRIEDCVVAVRANTGEVVDALRRYYHPFVCEPVAADLGVIVIERTTPALDLPFRVVPPAPGKTRVKDEIVDLDDGRVLRKQRTGMVFCFGPAGNIAAGPCLDNLNQVVNFINNRYIQRRVAAADRLCHAAGVARGDRGLAIAGLAGRGKSTLALHLLTRELDFVSNDRLLVTATDPPGMRGLPKFPRVNPGTILNTPRLERMLDDEQRARLASLSEDELWDLEDKHDVDITRYFDPGRFRLRATATAFVVLAWDRGRSEPPLLRPVSLAERGDLLAAIVKPPGVHYYRAPDQPPPATSPADYLRVLASIPAYEIAGGVDFDRAAALCLGLLR